ncbi:DUF1638 domain-containing protein [Pseudoramibacter alactolyticus]|jgi:hypothetical protein|uniref:DUF1638 domain-containing protein n=1 Tax=Pseudoramibacter alactolyticus TaxID=113287 RepID=UPI0028E8702E|nr:DUF1638 domain-containing protein [Pseudoramibacter alactolyticus]
MKPVILACGNLVHYVMAAQKKCGTHYPVVALNMRLHVDPPKMREAAVDALDRRIPGDRDTVLVAQGYCGGVWEGIAARQKIVIPRFDDCVSIALTTDDTYHPDLKQPGHFYMFNIRSGFFSPERLYRRLAKEHGQAEAQALFDTWFADYDALDVVDTGVEDLTREPFAGKAKRGADLMKAQVHPLPGSNRVLEKLITGRWDDQFMVKAPGEIITRDDFFSENWQAYAKERF